jgi:M6 family metalloprotease-like protein
MAGGNDDDGNNNRKLRGSELPRPSNGRELKMALSHVRRNLESKTTPTGGKLRNLVIMMRWSDHGNRKLPTRDQIDILMNHEGPHQLAPTGSVRDAFLENSYGKLDLESVVIDWIPMSMSESYVTNGESGLTLRFHDAIRDALEYVESNNLADFSYFDADQNGEIDAITFFHSGYAAERGGPDEYGTQADSRVWSHKWALHRPFVSETTGVEVSKYHVSSALWGLRGSGIGRIGVIVHETGHFLGLPDLYDRDEYGGTGVGTWGMMGNSWGFDWSQHYPPHGSAFMKAELGWVDVQTPEPGVNMISHTTDHEPEHPQIYKIDEGFPNGEYLLIENRQPYGLDSLIPQGGLIIYHVDEAAPLYNEGFPGQPGWPTNGNHYSVAVAQADGMYHLEGGVNGLNVGDAGDPFHGAGVNSLTPCFDIEDSCRYPNTDSYQNGIVNRTNVQITDISNSGDVMSFHYEIFGSQLPPPALPPPGPSVSSGASTILPSAVIDGGFTGGTTALVLAGGLAILNNTSSLLGMATIVAAMVCGSIL